MEDNKFQDNELFFRCVVTTAPGFIDSNERPSSAAFSDSKKGGTSVDRQMGRNIDDCSSFLKQTHDGIVVTISYQDIKDANVFADYDPTPDNIYHTQLYGDSTKKQLTKAQRKKLAQNCNVVSDINK